MNSRGQTVVEYLMLLAFVFIIAFVVMTGPFGDYATEMVENIHNSIGNVIQNAEWATERIDVGDPKHPSNPNRFKALHL